jgi:XapX domain-containing protein
MLSAALSLLAGLVVGIGYGLCGIRSPAPPAIALLGLLGMLAGEHGVVLAWRHFASQLHQAPRAEAPAKPSDDGTLKTPRG